MLWSTVYVSVRQSLGTPEHVVTYLEYFFFSQSQAETARRAAEDEENRMFEAQRLRIQALEQEARDKDLREQRRKERTAEAVAFAGVKVWGGWRRELGGPPRLIPSRPTKPRPVGPQSNRPGALTPQKTVTDSRGGSKVSVNM